MTKKTYTIKEKLWVYPGDMANWHFVTVTKSVGADIKERYGKNARGFGSLPVEVTVGKTVWNTSLFPDKRVGSYLLPIKAKVRKSEELEEGDVVKLIITLI